MAFWLNGVVVKMVSLGRAVFWWETARFLSKLQITHW